MQTYFCFKVGDEKRKILPRYAETKRLCSLQNISPVMHKGCLMNALDIYIQALVVSMVGHLPEKGQSGHNLLVLISDLNLISAVSDLTSKNQYVILLFRIHRLQP